MTEGAMVRQCYIVDQETLLYRKPGNYILYHRKEARLQCKKGWTGNKCDSCDVNYGPRGLCDNCLTGWAGENCDACALGWSPPACTTCQFCFSSESNCTECIENGRWTGMVRHQDLTVWLTFTKETCSELVPGTFFVQKK